MPSSTSFYCMDSFTPVPLIPFLSATILLACLFITIAAISIQKRNKKYPLPPGPSPWPILGNLPEMHRNKPAFKWINTMMEKLSTDIACIRLGNVHVVVVSSPELARAFLHNHDPEFSSRPLNMSSELASYGFLTMGLTPANEQWKKMRKIYTHEFVSAARMRWLFEKRNEEGDNLVRYIYHQCSVSDGAVVDLRSALRHYCISVLRRMTFGSRHFGENTADGGPGEAEKEHVEAIFTVIKYINAFCPSDYLPWLRVLDIDGHEKIVANAMRVLNRFYKPLVNERMQQWRDGKREEPQDLLDVMISLRDSATGQPSLSVDEIISQCAEFFFPLDNPVSTVEWIIAELINQPNLLSKAMEEIDRVVGMERLVQESDIPKLNYLKACVREAFRLHPSTPFNLPHVSTADNVVNGYFIPAGSHLLPNRVRLGRNPKVWEDALRFKPERHFDGDVSGKVELGEPNLGFVSFGTGKRRCPAIALGTAMTMVALGRLLQGFTWSVPQSEESIDLSEAATEIILAKPLHAHAKPRLPLPTYHM